nr:peptidase [Pseudoalteromonas sp.]
MAIFNSSSLKYTLLPFSLAALLTGCGGGGSDNATNPTTDNSGWTLGVFASSGQFKGQCQTINEKNWLRSWSNETCLWYDEIIDTNPVLTSGVIDYFNTLKTEQLTESGA